LPDGAVRKGSQPPAKEIQKNLNQLKSTFEYLNCNLTLYQLISSTKEWTEDIEGK
ncbi:MAG TPA: SAM-dependent methyltransferase, partial [Lachnoclostridium phytofermentans]|nr:SAM-dependent methyltransferase [Lachnoclostridium phytofermentans]